MLRLAALRGADERQVFASERGCRHLWRLSYYNRIRLWGGLFVAPALSIFLVFKYTPMAWAMWLSLSSYDLLTPPRFIGLSTYESLANDTLFAQALANTLTYVIGSTIPIWILALLLALVFASRNQYAVWSRVWSNFLVSALFLTNVMPVLVAAVVWKFLYHPTGLINQILGQFGVARIDWLADERTAMPAMILVTVWRFAPYFMLVFLAGLLAIPRDYYEAAALDGAGVWQQFRNITLPLLAPVMAFVVVVSVLLTARIFLMPFVMTQGGPGGATRVLAMYIYENGFTYLKMGRAAAASVVLFAIVLLFTTLQLRLFKEAEET